MGHDEQPAPSRSCSASGPCAAAGLTLSIIIVLVGIWAILMGALEIAAAFEVRRLPKRFDKLAREAR